MINLLGWLYFKFEQIGEAVFDAYWKYKTAYDNKKRAEREKLDG